MNVWCIANIHTYMVTIQLELLRTISTAITKSNKIKLVFAYRMVGNFCGVQIFLDFVHSAYPQKLLNFSYITK